MRAADLTGQTFGRLTAVGCLGNYRNHTPWVCDCACGNVTTANADALHRGVVKSCGECTKQGRKLPGIYARNQVWWQYKCSANKRRLVWDLSSDDFDRLTGSSCRYCGVAPAKIYIGANGNFVYNGLDRVENSQGYTLANVVPCCQTCNLAKRDMSVEDFLTWARRVARFNEVN